jgi:cell wall-associated NlpC family hydrolase
MEIRRVDNQKISIHQSQARKIHSISKDGILKRAERPEDLLSLEKIKSASREHPTERIAKAASAFLSLKGIKEKNIQEYDPAGSAWSEAGSVTERTAAGALDIRSRIAEASEKHTEAEMKRSQMRQIREDAKKARNIKEAEFISGKHSQQVTADIREKSVETMMQNQNMTAGNQQVSPGATEIKSDAGNESAPGLQYVRKVNTIDSGDRIHRLKGASAEREGMREKIRAMERQRNQQRAWKAEKTARAVGGGGRIGIIRKLKRGTADEAVKAKAGTKGLAFFVPLFLGMLLCAIPVFLLMSVFYLTPLSLFAPPLKSDTANIRTILTGYYADFNGQIEAKAGSDDANISYLHEENGTAKSNFNDVLMVYLVKYGLGANGTEMTDENRKHLKEVFDEMNSFTQGTTTKTVQAGAYLGPVVTSGYCNCAICCGPWADGLTASGVVPKANHTIAVDSKNPFLPMGTKVIMNGIEYTVEDTGPLEKYGVIFDVYYDVHAVAQAHGHQTWDCYLADGNANTVTVTENGFNVRNLNYEDYIAKGTLNDEQVKWLKYMMTTDFSKILPGTGIGTGSAIGAQAVALGMQHVGEHYSQDRRWDEGYYDCSSFVYRMYIQLGIELPTTAAEQAEYCDSNHLTVTEAELSPGDLIFYSYSDNGRYKNVSHVAIYAGNGMEVEAANSNIGVVYREFRPSNIGLYGRPYGR